MPVENQERDQLCSVCGEKLVAGDAFCMNCGTPVPKGGVDTAGADMTAATARNMSEPDGSDSPTSATVGATVSQVKPIVPQGATDATLDSSPDAKKPFDKKLIAVIAGVVVVIVLAIVLAIMFLTPKDADNDVVDEIEQEQVVKDDSEPEDSEAVVLSNSYTTRFEEINKVTFPQFTFKYPDDWEITDEYVGPQDEDVTLTKTGSDLNIVFHYTNQGTGGTRAEIKSIEKVADSDFWPYYVQANDHTGMGPFMVARMDLEYVSTGTEESFGNDEVYAVLPETVLLSSRQGFLPLGGYPGFDYSGLTSFYCAVPADGISDHERDEVIAILASFSNGTTKADYEKAASGSAVVGLQSASGAYILGDSNSRYYSESELLSMDLHDLYLARNEIFARHGRLFNNQDLQAYFNGKDWYNGTVSPSNFNEDVFNDYEKKNAALMLEVERNQNSPYLNP